MSRGTIHPVAWQAETTISRLMAAGCRIAVCSATPPPNE